jgi:hypothetical protein
MAKKSSNLAETLEKNYALKKKMIIKFKQHAEKIDGKIASNARQKTAV